VIVKTQRPDDHWRGTDTTVRERAALEFLAERNCDAAPQLLVRDDRLGIVVLEDLGAGPAVEDVLVGTDPDAARSAVLAHATALARMQAATVGQPDAFYRRLEGVDRRLDRVCVQVMPFQQRWGRLKALAGVRPELPDVGPAEPDIESILSWLDQAGSMLALSNGDFMPQNSKLADGRVRLLDFEGATFQHALLDAAHLRIPYAAAPAWSRLPAEVSARAEQAYRAELVGACPEVGDDESYQRGIAASAAAWSVNRLTRLAGLEERDRPHPLGYSRRGQMLDLLQTAIDACRAADTLPGLRGWFEATLEALRRRWPGLPDQQAVYPAFRSAQPRGA
jgi:aminoglycoside/choline kinase family phosphotransferase